MKLQENPRSHEYLRAADLAAGFCQILEKYLSPQEIIRHEGTLISLFSARQQFSDTDWSSGIQDISEAASQESGLSGLVIKKITEELLPLGNEQLGSLAILYLVRWVAALNEDAQTEYTPLSVVALCEKLVGVFHEVRGSKDEQTISVFDPYVKDGALLLQIGRAVAARTYYAQGVKKDSIVDCVQSLERGFADKKNEGDSTLPFRLADQKNSDLLGCVLEEIFTPLKVERYFSSQDFLLDQVFTQKKFSYICSMPPLNQGAWKQGIATQLGTWEYGAPPQKKANFAWIERALTYLEEDGLLCLVMANDVLWTLQEQEKAIKENLIANNLIEAIVSLPARLMEKSSLNVSILLFSKGRSHDNILMIDAQELGSVLDDGIHRIVGESAIESVAAIWASWLADDGSYYDQDKLCRRVSPAEISQRKYLLAPELFMQVDAAEALTTESIGDMLDQIRCLSKELSSVDKELLALIEKLGEAHA